MLDQVVEADKHIQYSPVPNCCPDPPRNLQEEDLFNEFDGMDNI